MKKILTMMLIVLTVSLTLTGCFYVKWKNALKISPDSVPDIPLKYPVILVHGIVAFDRGEGSSIFWGRIPGVLRESGAKVYFGNTDAWGGYESNAEILKGNIEKILIETNSEKINIIAHSKGGIDSRYLIWKYDFGDKVASLTTVSTPHRGAEIADLIYSREIIHSDIAKEALKIFGELYGDTKPDMYNVNYILTTENMREFNKKVTMDSRVFYQSLYTTIDGSFSDLTMVSGYWYIKVFSGENDGIVSEYSAKWGINPRKIASGISHAEIIDVKRKKIGAIDVPDLYLDIVHDLAAKGF